MPSEIHYFTINTRMLDWNSVAVKEKAEGE
jgi:hypothetical protein